jgi:hypothetical protein
MNTAFAVFPVFAAMSSIRTGSEALLARRRSTEPDPCDPPPLSSFLALFLAPPTEFAKPAEPTELLCGMRKTPPRLSGHRRINRSARKTPAMGWPPRHQAPQEIRPMDTARQQDT